MFRTYRIGMRRAPDARGPISRLSRSALGHLLLKMPFGISIQYLWQLATFVKRSSHLYRSGLTERRDNSLRSRARVTQYARKTRVGSEDLLWAIRQRRRREVASRRISMPASSRRCRRLHAADLFGAIRSGVDNLWISSELSQVHHPHILLIIRSLFFIYFLTALVLR